MKDEGKEGGRERSSIEKLRTFSTPGDFSYIPHHLNSRQHGGTNIGSWVTEERRR